MTLMVLFAIEILAVLTQLQEYFKVDNRDAAFFQVIFIVAYMLLAPLFGYLGDRYNRKILMIVGIGKSEFYAGIGDCIWLYHW